MRLIHRRFASALCVLACALSLTAAARADPSWRLLGPYGGNILSLAVDPANPRVVYAGSPAGGVFKSADAGAKWVWSGAGLETDNFFRGITALAVDPRNPARIFAGVQGYGVYRSIDAGRTWHSAFTRPAGETWRLVIDPNPGGAVYAGSSSGIFRSLDGGTSWQARGPSVPVIALAFDPAFRILYAGLALGGVLRSANGGATWTAGRGLPEGQAFSLVVDPRQAGVVVAGFDRSMARSTDFGRTWTRVKKTQSPVVALASQRSKRLLYAAVAAARIFRSADSGATWQAAPGQPSDRDFNALAAGPGFVYTATKSSEHLGGIFRSSDAASTWTLSVKGFSTLTTTLAVDPSDPEILFAGAGPLGVFRSRDGGATWDLQDLGTGPRFITDVFIEPAVPATVYAVSQEGAPFRRSDDRGETWQPLAGVTGRRDVRLSRLSDDPQAPGALWAVGEGGVFHSFDSGATWAPASIPPVAPGYQLSMRDVWTDTRDPSIVWASGASFSGNHPIFAPQVFRSADRGQSWQQRSVGFPDRTFVWVQRVRNGIDPELLFAATDAGMFRSADEGVSWSLAPGLPVLPIGWGFAVTPSALWAGVDAVGPYRSTDGVTWTLFRRGLTSRRLSELVADPGDPERLFAATVSGGVSVLVP